MPVRAIPTERAADMPKASRLLAPDIDRMAVIEQQLAAIKPRLHELEARIEATRGPREAGMHRLYDLDHDDATEAHLRVEAASADRAWQAAVEAWRTAEGPAFALREEWLQLQVVRSFLPRCAMCEEGVGPIYLELGRDGDTPSLCLGCLDTCEGDPRSGRRPPSYWMALTAQQARELETARRQESGATTPHSSSARLCWHCGGPVDDLGGMDATSRHDGTVAARVVLKVAAIVSAGTSPELGEVCLRCLDRDVGLFERWKGIEQDLCDPDRRGHERALHDANGRSEARERPRTAASALAGLPQPAVAMSHDPPVGRTAGR